MRKNGNKQSRHQERANARMPSSVVKLFTTRVKRCPKLTMVLSVENHFFGFSIMDNLGRISKDLLNLVPVFHNFAKLITAIGLVAIVTRDCHTFLWRSRICRAKKFSWFADLTILEHLLLFYNET